MLQRNGLVKAFAVNQRRDAEVIPPVRARSKPGSLRDTDDWQAYARLRRRGEQIVIRKEKGRPKGRERITVSRASGALLNTGCIRTAVCRESFPSLPGRNRLSLQPSP
ncbi:MAG: hypothetical protein Kow0073_14620 [Immundisolibacter sp.]